MQNLGGRQSSVSIDAIFQKLTWLSCYVNRDYVTRSNFERVDADLISRMPEVYDAAGEIYPRAHWEKILFLNAQGDLVAPVMRRIRCKPWKKRICSNVKSGITIGQALAALGNCLRDVKLILSIHLGTVKIYKLPHGCDDLKSWLENQLQAEATKLQAALQGEGNEKR